jgi:hypothetical protein
VQILLQLIGLVLLGFELCQGLVLYCALATEVPPNLILSCCLFYFRKIAILLPIENLLSLEKKNIK